MRKTTKFVAVLPALLVLAACTAPAGEPEDVVEVPAAGSWNGNTSIYIPADAGGGFDIAARALQQYLAEELGASVIPVNVPGAGGALAAGEMLAAPADGTSMMIVSRSISALPYTGTPDIDPLSDFTALGVTHQDMAALTVPGNAPYQTAEEFAAYAKANPGKLKIGHSGIGGVWHAAALMFAREVGTEFVFVPYSGGSQVGAALLAGEIDAMMIGAPESRPFIEGGAKMLAVFGDERTSMYPDVPTLKERGINVTYSVWRGYVTSSATPPAIAAELAKRLEAAAKKPGFLDAMAKAGFDTTWVGQAEFQKLIEEEDKLITTLFAGEDFMVSEPNRG